jgi:hypothetical protein
MFRVVARGILLLASLFLGTMSCAGPRRATLPLGTYPAGEEFAEMAVVLGPFPDAKSAAKARDGARVRSGLTTGYPYVATLAELRVVGRPVGLAVVLGLYDERGESRARTTLRDGAWLARIDNKPPDDREKRVVETIVDATAWTEDDLVRIEREISSCKGSCAAKRPAALSNTRPVCVVPQGSVHVVDRKTLYRFDRTYAPAVCPDGRRAWIVWTATRVDAVVENSSAGPVISQIIAYSCDLPVYEMRSFPDGNRRFPREGKCRS